MAAEQLIQPEVSAKGGESSLAGFSSVGFIGSLDWPLNQTSANATGANADGLSRAINDCLHPLEIWQPTRFSLDVRMGNLVTGFGTFFTELTKTCHGLILPLRDHKLIESIDFCKAEKCEF